MSTSHVHAQATASLNEAADASSMWPPVTVVVLNYNGWRFLPTCLDALAATDYPQEAFHVLVVDNASVDGSVERLHNDYPWVGTLTLPRNLGFSGGNNTGIKASTTPYVVLLNNDTAVDPGWLKPLVRAAQVDPMVGACGAQLLFYYAKLALTLRVEGSFVPAQVLADNGDTRVLGVRLLEADLGPTSLPAQVAYADGWYDQESADGSSYRWSSAHAVLEIPVAQQASMLSLKLTLAGPPAPLAAAQVAFCLGDQVIHTVEVGPDPVTTTLQLHAEQLQHAQFYIQNAGQELLPGGYCRDRGAWAENNVEYHVPAGYYNQQEEVFGLCGAAVLLRRAMLDQIGLLDDAFFMYYEDIDLSWRARAMGWRLLYVPQSVVRHVHSGSSGAWSPFFRYHVERNRLLMLIKNAPWKLAGVAVADYVRATCAWLLRSGRALRHNRASARANWSYVTNNIRVLLGLLRLLPYVLRQRRYIRQHATIRDELLLRWMVH